MKKLKTSQKLKICSLFVVLVALSFNQSIAQVVFSVEFNSDFGDTPTWSQQPEWTVYDEDGLETELWIKPTWRVSYSWKCALTTSNYLTPGQADNWMILPLISLPTNSPYVKWISWSVDASLKDSYEVLVSTTDTNIDSFTQIYYNDAEGTTHTTRTLDLSDYAGDDIYIAFRHNSYDKYILCVADIEVGGSTSMDVELTSAYDIVETAEVPCEVALNNIVVTNKGNETVNTLDLNWTLDNGIIHTESFSDLNLEPLIGSVTLSHPSLPELTDPLNYEFKLWVSNPNGTADQFNENDTINMNICGISQTPEKYVVIEEGTYTTCGYCPDGALVMQGIIDNNPNVIGVSIHNGSTDPMTIPEGEIVNGAYITAFPRATVDRRKFPAFDEVGFGRGDWAAYANIRSNIAVPASIDGIAKYDEDTRGISIELEADFYGESVNEYRVNAYIIEDSVTGGPEYNQSNSYNNTPGHPLNGMGSPIVGYNHMHVLRAMLGGAWGTEDVVSTPTADGDSYPYVYHYTLPEDFDSDQIKVVVLVQKYSEDVNDRENINAKELELLISTDISDIEEQNNIRLFPNPCKDQTTLSFNSHGVEMLNINIFNLYGQKVKTLEKGRVGIGEQNVVINTSDLSRGYYLIQVQIGENISIQKIFITNSLK